LKSLFLLPPLPLQLPDSFKTQANSVTRILEYQGRETVSNCPLPSAQPLLAWPASGLQHVPGSVLQIGTLIKMQLM
jgi:hypothetical protein